MRKRSDFRPFKIVITGFNTDIEHDGVVYHVQTEDKGLDSPLILSLVYSGGAILASKRTRYEDLIAQGFDEELLTQRLKRQHRLICAAINAGRLEDLKQMGAKAPQEVIHVATPVFEAVITEAPEEIVATVVDAAIRVEYAAPPLEIIPLSEELRTTVPVPEPDPPIELAAPEPEPEPEPIAEVVPVKKRGRARTTEESAYNVYDPRRQEPSTEARAEEGSFALSLLDEEDYRAGQSYTIRILVEDRTARKRKPMSGVGVSLKILGTAFRPQIYSVKTERDGVASVEAVMPSFISGRAAVLIRVVVKGEPREVRRVIHPAE